MKQQKRFMKLLCLVLALSILLPAIPAQASTNDLGTGYHASTTFGDEHVSKAFDNDPATRWSGSAEQNQWICAIFENEVVINSVEILEFWDRMTSFEIQYLDENGVWQTCANKITNTQNTQTDTTHQLSFAPVKTTGMRLYIHDAPGWPSIYEFKMFYGEIQIVDGKSAVGYHASTTFGDEHVGKAFDNDPNTRWSACADQNQWITAIFENEVVISSVEILEFWDRMTSFKIQYLDENGVWQTCANKITNTQNTQTDTTHQLSFAPVKTTGMRLYIHDAPNWASIYEFKMFYGEIQIVDGKSAVGYHASTTFGDENVGKAFDNDSNTRWSGSAEQNQWICAIFENEVLINSVEIKEFLDRMNAFDIQYLDENGIWQTCASKVIETPDTGIDTTHQLSFAPVKTTGMRLYIHDAPGWPSIYEFKMFYDQSAPIAQVGEQSYETVAEAIANAGGGVVKMLVDSDEAIAISDDVTIDLAGNVLSNITVAQDATLTLIDSATNDYEGEYGSASVNGEVKTFAEVDGKTYMVVSENGVYSAHCYDVAITHISLKPAKDALGYKAKLFGDEIVQSHVESFGFNLWVDGGRVKTFSKTGTDVLTLRLQNILAAGGGEMNIHATAFVTLKVGEQTTTKTGTQQTTTMKETLQAVNSAWYSYSDAQREAVYALYDKYMSILCNWELDNISGPILHYDMSTSGETVVDSAGDYDGTLVGTTALVDGVDGYGVHVAGGEDYISVPREAFLKSQDVTFSAWVKLDSVATGTTILSIGDGSTNKMILSVNGNPNGYLGMTVVLQQNGQPEVCIAAGNCMNPTVNEWAHVAYTQTGSTAELYLNGERVQQITNMTGTIKGILEASQNATVRIGDNHVNDAPSMVGTISDVEVYGRALSSEGIRKKYDEKLASGAVLYYEMTETGEKVTDRVGNYHGTLVGNAVWTDGMNGKAVHVAGGTDYISIPREALMQSDDVTISMWVKLDSISTWTTLFSVGNGPSNYMILGVMGNPFGRSVGVTAAIKENGGEEVRVSAASGVNPAIGDWALVSYVQSGSVATLYLNGEQVAQVENMTGTIKGVLEASDAADVRVGDNQIYGDPSMVGAIGEVMIKNRAPLGDEIAEAYLAKKDAELILHYDMHTQGEVVTDSVGDYDGTMNGNTSWVEGMDVYAVHVGGADNDYIGVPREAFMQAEAVTFSAWINLEKISTWTTILGIGNNASNYMLFTAKGAPFAKEVGLSVAIKENGGAEVRVSAEVPSQPTVGKWALVTYTQIGNVATLYLDGKQVAQTTSMLGSIKGVLEASQDADIRIGDNQIFGDPSMAAAIADVMIYKGAVTPEVLQAEVAVKADIIEQKFIAAEAASLDLGDLSNVMEDLVLPTQTANGLSVTWDSSNPAFVDAEGKVNFPTEEQGDQEIVLTATVSNQDGTKTAVKTFTFILYALTDARVVEEAANYVQRYVDYLINDGYELLTGKNMDTYTGKSYGCDIQWELTAGEAEIKDGKIVKTIHSAERQPIKLKAIVTKGEASKEVVFENVTLIDEYVGYIMSFFGGNDGLQTLHLGFSHDGFNWEPLNNGLSVHTPEGGSGVVRDPCIMRKKDGSFCVVATNDWNNPTIYLWDSEDLVSFTNERVSTVAYEGEVGLTGARAWAPEAVYDPIKDEYIVFWSDPYANGNNGNIYGNTSKDLEEFSHPFEFFTTDYPIIDASIIKWRGVNYMVFKDETGNNSGTAGGKVIYMAKSDSLEAGSFKQYTGAITEILVEGPFMFKLNNEEKWVHYYDYFNEHKFGVSTSTDLAGGEWEFLGKSTTMPTNDVRHGGVVAVTQKEMDRILEGYNYK